MSTPPDNLSPVLTERLRANSANDLIYRFRVRPAFAAEYVSQSALKVTGWTAEELVNTPHLTREIVHPDDRQIVSKMWTDPQNCNAPTVLRWMRPNGQLVFLDHRRAPILDVDGRLVAVEGYARDVSERVEMESRLRDSDNRLRRLSASQHSARETERALIARELHDELGQNLTGLKLEMTLMVRDLLPTGLDPQMIDRLQSLIGGIECATETVRRMATKLRPPALDHLGLDAAIELEASALTRRTGIRCRVAGQLRVVDLAPEQSIVVFRIVQEALTNVARHANASAVKVLMRQNQRATTVQIQDNGRGISEDAMLAASSIGLAGCASVPTIGATLSILTRTGKATIAHDPGRAPLATDGTDLLVDDHPVVRRGSADPVDGEGRDHRRGERRAGGAGLSATDVWDVVVLDLTLPGSSGLDFQEVRRTHPTRRCWC